jgi:hypothetical protein
MRGFWIVPGHSIFIHGLGMLNPLLSFNGLLLSAIHPLSKIGYRNSKSARLPRVGSADGWHSYSRETAAHLRCNESAERIPSSRGDGQ